MVWSWRQTPSSDAEVSELFQLLSDLFEYRWKPGADKWSWKGDKNGLFSVRGAKQVLADPGTAAQSEVFIKWKTWTPLKCKIMVWRAALNRLPTKMELLKRGVLIEDVVCPMCGEDNETLMHLLTGCIVSTEIWARVSSWCNITPLIVFDVKDLLALADLQPYSKKEKDILRGIIYTTIWMLWIERNSRVFEGKHRRPLELLANIKTVSFFWFRHRSRIKRVEWNTWCNSPLNAL
ncbi:putative reverse transcriptase zinc-binding domain-containing protein [Helianthus anomalus]